MQLESKCQIQTTNQPHTVHSKGVDFLLYHAVREEDTIIDLIPL
jgi:hypothetical protein